MGQKRNEFSIIIKDVHHVYKGRVEFRGSSADPLKRRTGDSLASEKEVAA